MVRTEKNKVIIEIELDEFEKPAEVIENLQNSIIEAVQFYNYKDFPEPNPVYYLLEFLKATMPTIEQKEQILKRI